MKRILPGLIIALLFFSNVSAQLSKGGTPIGFKSTMLKSDIPKVSMAKFNVDEMLKEDEENNKMKLGPYRFGKNFDVYISPKSSGKWTTLKNGDRIWQVAIESKGAYSINLIFNDYLLPEGAKLFIYNKDRTHVIGAFTAVNNQEDRKFATDLVKGEEIIVEYFEPKIVAGQGSIIISTVTHAYRDLFSQDFLKNFGSSGSCNMNVNCPDGTDWQDQKRSVVMLVSGGSGFCTGALINNANNDGKPYVLTANHCGSSGFNTWVFRFNWEAASCSNPGSSPSYVSLTGGAQRASRSESDFSLVEITGGLQGGTIPSSYNVYFSGWNNVNAAATSAVGIHHPSGDIKKISFDDNTIVSSQSMGSVANNEWQVTWNRNTTTEGGSSGSPLFDQNHRIIGQLWGGGASCSNTSGSDFYGKFAISWNTGTSSSSRLKDWLDPSNSGVTTVDGYDPNSPSVSLDAGISSITSPSGTSCDTMVSPSITLKNYGTDELTSVTINYGFDGNTNLAYSWTGTLASNGSATITLPDASVSEGSHTFTAETSNPNGSTDLNTDNDLKTGNFSTVMGTIVSLNLVLDNYGSETEWQILSGTTALYSGGPYADGAGGTSVNESFCLADDCYDFKITDSYGDGICCNEGNGSYTLTNDNTIETLASGATFTTSETKNFCVTLSNELTLKVASQANVKCKGEANGSITLKGIGGVKPYTYSNDGVAYQSSDVYSGLTAGTYTYFIKDSNGDVATYQVTITEPQVLGLSINSFTNTTCGNSNGLVMLSATGGTTAYTYSKNGTTYQASATFTNLAANDYVFYVKDANACISTDSISIASSVGPTAIASASKDTVYLDQGATVQFTSNSTNVTGVSWNFGDGASSTSASASHTYTQAGTYTVTLTANYNNCTSTATLYVRVYTSVGISNNYLEEALTIYPNPSKGNIKVDFGSTGILEDATIQLRNSIGANLGVERISKGQKSHNMNLLELPPGIYYMNIITSQNTITRKVILIK